MSITLPDDSQSSTTPRQAALPPAGHPQDVPTDQPMRSRGWFDLSLYCKVNSFLGFKERYSLALCAAYCYMSMIISDFLYSFPPSLCLWWSIGWILFRASNDYECQQPADFSTARYSICRLVVYSLPFL